MSIVNYRKSDKHKSDFIVAIVAESGCGKTSVVNMLEDKYNYKSINSYTTRAPRSIGERGHRFISKADYWEWDKDEFVAFTEFDNNYYFATRDQVKESELYVVDVAGVDYLRDKLKNTNTRVIVININTNESTRIQRMASRGDSRCMIDARIKNDREMFKGLEFDYSVLNEDLGKCVKIIDNIIKEEVGALQLHKRKCVNKWNKILKWLHLK